MEAGGLQDVADDFVDETDLPFSFLLALYEGATGADADKEDVEAYFDTIGKPDFPILADGKGKIVDATPMESGVHPQMCALSDELVILGCHAGHGAYDDALDDIRAEASR